MLPLPAPGSFQYLAGTDLGQTATGASTIMSRDAEGELTGGYKVLVTSASAAHWRRQPQAEALREAEKRKGQWALARPAERRLGALAVAEPPGRLPGARAAWAGARAAARPVLRALYVNAKYGALARTSRVGALKGNAAFLRVQRGRPPFGAIPPEGVCGVPPELAAEMRPELMVWFIGTGGQGRQFAGVGRKGTSLIYC